VVHKEKYIKGKLEMNLKHLIIAFFIVMIVGMSGSAAVSTEGQNLNAKLLIKGPVGVNFAASEIIPVEFMNSQPGSTKVSIIGYDGQKKAEKVVKNNRPGRTQIVNFQAGSELSAGSYYVQLEAFNPNGKSRGLITGGNFNIVVITTLPYVGKQQWYKGGNYAISWTTTPFYSLNTVIISASAGGHDLGIIAKVSAANRTYQWYIPENFGAGFDLSSVIIRVTDVANPKIYGDGAAISIANMPLIPLIVTPSNSGPVSGNGLITRSFVVQNLNRQDVAINAISLSCRGNCSQLSGQEPWFTQEPYDPPTIFFQAQHLVDRVVRPGEKRIIWLSWASSEADNFNIVLLGLQEQVGNYQYQNAVNLFLPAN